MSVIEPQAPSGNRTRALRLGKAAFWAAELPARRRHVQEWVREDSNLHDRYFTPALCLLSYRPVRTHRSATSGTCTRGLLRDKQALWLPELWRRYGRVFGCQRTRTNVCQRRVEDSNLRGPSRTPRVSTALHWTALPTLRLDALHTHSITKAEGVGVEPT